MYERHHNISTHAMNSGKYIVVNADDYGYYDCVSEGIVDAAHQGVVTAAGMFANSPFLERHLHWLKQCNSLDAGVHLNLTDRSPLTPELRDRLAASHGCFPGKFTISSWVLSGRIPMEEIVREFRAQIERCMQFGVHIKFLNSHEHIHMLPPVFRITQDLAAEYDIRHIRYAIPDTPGTFKSSALFRDVALGMLGRINRKHLKIPVLPFLGMAVSGKMNLEYLKRTFSNLSPGVYELMCHPGACRNDDETEPGHRAYHDWKGELDALSSNRFLTLCKQENITLVGYRHLDDIHRLNLT